MSISHDYKALNRMVTKHKAALTRAKKKGPQAVLDAVAKAYEDFDKTMHPDNWRIWEVAREDAERELRKAGIKRFVVLLSGEVVKELVDQVPLKQVVTHCPRKWALVDLQSGQVYGWKENGDGYIAPPPIADKALQQAMRKLQHE